MIFTQEQINEIKQRLSLSGIKDSELDKLDLLEHPLTGKEVITIVKDEENLRISVEDLYEEFAKYIEQSENKEDFFNVSVYLGRLDPEFEDAAKPCTLEEAINACPSYIRRAGQTISFLDSSNMKWETYQYIGTEDDDWMDITLFVNHHQVLQDQIDAIPDYEDLTQNEGGQLKFADKTYNAATYTGLGRKYLRKNIVSGVNTLTQDMLVDANTIYHIQYDYTLGENITIPKNCILEFDGGSISGAYTLTGSNTVISETTNKIFGTDIIMEGTFITSLICPEMFGAKGDGITDDVDAIQKAELFTHCTLEKRVKAYATKQYHNSLTLLNRNYGIKKTIYISPDISIIGNGAVIIPLNGGVFDTFTDDNRKYMIASKDVIPGGDAQRVVWENFSLNANNSTPIYTDGPISGIYFGAQGYIRRIQTYGIDNAIYISDSYKDFVEIDGIYLMDGNPDVWKIHGGYLGDARNFKNIWSSTEKALQVGSSHFSCSVDHMISGSLEIDRSDTSVTNCMFNSSAASKVYVSNGAKVVFTNCYFGYTGVQKVIITDGPYNWRKSKVTFISCTFNYNPPYLIENFEDNPISAENNSNITFIDTYFNDQDVITQANMYKHAPHIKNLDGLNTYIGIGLNNSNKTLYNVKLDCSVNVSAKNISASSQAANLLGTTETWNYTITILYDVNRQLIGNTIIGSASVTPNEGAFIRLDFSNTNLPPALYIKKTRGNITEYAIIPACTFDPSFYDNGITIAGRKWTTGDILDTNYATSPLEITYRGIKPNNIEPTNVEIVTNLTSAQFNNRIKNNNTTNWKAGDIVELNDYTRLIKKRDGNWYTINETVLS